MNQIFLLKKAIELTESSLAMVQSGDWEGFTKAEPNRLHFIQQIDMSQIEQAHADEARACMEKLIALNDELKLLCEQTKQEAVDGLKSLKKGASAIKAYK